MRYISKPTEIEAVQWRGGNLEEIHEFLDCPDAPSGVGLVKPRGLKEDEGYELLLLAGKDGSQEFVPVPVGHWIVRQPGDYSDHWPVDPDYFAKKYEEVPSPPERQPAVLADGRHTIWCRCDGRGIVPGPVGGRAVKCPAEYEEVPE